MKDGLNKDQKRREKNVYVHRNIETISQRNIQPSYHVHTCHLVTLYTPVGANMEW